MASRVEVRFIDECDFLIHGKGFILKDDADNLYWEVDSTISLEWNDSLDEISDFEEELRSGADSDPDSELSTSTSATHDSSDDSNFGAGPLAPNKGGRKKPKAKSQQRAGNINRRAKKSREPKVVPGTSEARPVIPTKTKTLKSIKQIAAGMKIRKQQRR